MKNSLKIWASRFLLGAVLTTQVATLSYGMDRDGSSLLDGIPSLSGDVTATLLTASASGVVYLAPSDIIATYDLLTMRRTTAECQRLAALSLDKEQQLKRDIDGLNIPALDGTYRQALSAAREVIPVDDNFNITGDATGDAATALTRIRDGKKAQSIWVVAQMQAEIFSEEAAKANRVASFFGASTAPLSFLSALRTKVVTRDMQLSGGATAAPQQYGMGGYGSGMYGGMYGGMPPHMMDPRVQDTSALAFVGGLETNGTIFLDLSGLDKRLPPRADRVDIHTLLADVEPAILAQETGINAWLKEFPTVYAAIQGALHEAETQRNVLAMRYRPAELATMEAKDVLIHTKDLAAAKNLAEEEQQKMTVVQTVKEFLDEMADYLKKNSKIT